MKFELLLNPLVNAIRLNWMFLTRGRFGPLKVDTVSHTYFAESRGVTCAARQEGGGSLVTSIASECSVTCLYLQRVGLGMRGRVPSLSGGMWLLA